MRATAADYVVNKLSFAGIDLEVLQPAEAAELPDDGPVEWAPVVPYWSVLWRSGVALAREVASSAVAHRRLVELGCGLGVPSIVAAQRGASVLATDESNEALGLLGRNARANGVPVNLLRMDWRAPDKIVARGPFDLALAADVLYERSSVAPLLSLLGRLRCEVWIADPGRPAAGAFLEQARRDWSIDTGDREGVAIYRLRAKNSAAG